MSQSEGGLPSFLSLHQVECHCDLAYKSYEISCGIRSAEGVSFDNLDRASVERIEQGSQGSLAACQLSLCDHHSEVVPSCAALANGKTLFQALTCRHWVL